MQVYDTSSKKQESRAIYQGIEFIKYVLNKRWFDKEERSIVKGNDVTQYFKQEYNKLSQSTKKKLDYIKKFLNTDKINIETYCKNTLHDGQYDYFKHILDRGECSDE